MNGHGLCKIVALNFVHTVLDQHLNLLVCFSTLCDHLQIHIVEEVGENGYQTVVLTDELLGGGKTHIQLYCVKRKLEYAVEV